MPFAVLLIWREPVNHETDCYFCLTDVSKFRKLIRRAHNLQYPTVSSVSMPLKDLSLPPHASYQ